MNVYRSNVIYLKKLKLQINYDWIIILKYERQGLNDVTLIVWLTLFYANLIFLK